MEHVVREHSAALVRTLTFVVLDRQLAADITQETFVKLFVHWDKVSKHPDMPSWIYKVALNEAKDHRRALVRTTRLFERLAGEAAARVPEARWEPEAGFVDALKTLPKRQRVAAALFYVADLPLTEVARIMGISEGAVSSHLHRARESVKGLLVEG